MREKENITQYEQKSIRNFTNQVQHRILFCASRNRQDKISHLFFCYPVHSYCIKGVK